MQPSIAMDYRPHRLFGLDSPDDNPVYFPMGEEQPGRLPGGVLPVSAVYLVEEGNDAIAPQKPSISSPVTEEPGRQVRSNLAPRFHSQVAAGQLRAMKVFCR